MLWSYLSYGNTLIFLLLALNIFLFERKSKLHIYFGLLLISLSGIAASYFYNAHGYDGWLVAIQLLFYSLSNFTPFAIALLTFLLFEEKDISSHLFWWPAFIAIGLDTVDLGLSRDANWPNDLILIVIFEYLPQIIKLIYFLLACFAIFKSRAVDLIHSRFVLRNVVIIVLLIIGLEMLIFENLLALNYVMPYEPIYFHISWQFILAISCLKFCLVAIKNSQFYLTFPSKFTGPKKSKKRQWREWSKNAEKLDRLLTEREIFRDSSLSIVSLASTLSVPEYRLRHLINGELGYKNFNTLLNDHRVKAAETLFLDENKDHLPILTIALDVGYSSIAPFNRAFKQRHRMTPSEFRAMPH